MAVFMNNATKICKEVTIVSSPHTVHADHHLTFIVTARASLVTVWWRSRRVISESRRGEQLGNKSLCHHHHLSFLTCKHRTQQRIDDHDTQPNRHRDEL